MTDPETLMVYVPDYHPLAGQTLDIYPESGATSYLEGRLVFRSRLTDAVEGLRVELQSLVATVEAKLAQKEPL